MTFGRRDTRSPLPPLHELPPVPQIPQSQNPMHPAPRRESLPGLPHASPTPSMATRYSEAIGLPPVSPLLFTHPSYYAPPPIHFAIHPAPQHLPPPTLQSHYPYHPAFIPQHQQYPPFQQQHPPFSQYQNAPLPTNGSGHGGPPTSSDSSILPDELVQQIMANPALTGDPELAASFASVMNRIKAANRSAASAEAAATTGNVASGEPSQSLVPSAHGAETQRHAAQHPPGLLVPSLGQKANSGSSVAGASDVGSDYGSSRSPAWPSTNPYDAYLHAHATARYASPYPYHGYTTSHSTPFPPFQSGPYQHPQHHMYPPSAYPYMPSASTYLSQHSVSGGGRGDTPVPPAEEDDEARENMIWQHWLEQKQAGGVNSLQPGYLVPPRLESLGTMNSKSNDSKRTLTSEDAITLNLDASSVNSHGFQGSDWVEGQYWTRGQLSSAELLDQLASFQVD